MDDIKVSIMLTCYNCEDYINAAIKSVIMQDKAFKWELLIGDDGSSDKTVAYAKKWMEKYPEEIKLFIMDRTQDSVKNGTRAARNRANLLSHAAGQYLIFLDGDDQFLGTEKLKRQVEILDDSSNQNCACVAHNIVANDIQKNRKYPLGDISLKDGVVNTKRYWKSMYFHTNTILFRSCCKDLMLNPEYRDYLNDNFITYIILQYGEMYYLNELWAQYNLTGDGLWTGKKRIYGCFRNIILYDLEREVNTDLEYESFIRHLYDFRYLFSNYEANDRQLISSLVNLLPAGRFKHTELMYNLHQEVSKEQLKESRALKRRVAFIFYFYRVKRIPKKLLKIIKRQ